MEGTQSHTEGKLWFLFVLLYLIFDYGRPHDMVEGLRAVRPLMVLTLVLISYVIVKGRLDYFWSPHLNVIWMIVALIAIHTPFAENNYYAFQTFRSMFSYIPFLLSIVFVVSTMKRLRVLILTSVILMIVTSIYSIVNEGRGQGNYFLDENDVSLFINTWLPFCYYLFSVEKSVLKKTIYASGLVIGLVAVVVSFSRGGFVGLIAATIVVWLFSRQKIMAFAGIALLSMIVLYAGNEAYWNEMETVTDSQEATARTRILLWEAGWDMFLDNPLGVGGNNYQIRLPEYQSPEFPRSMWGRVAHSLWFTLIPELGIVGIVLFLILLVLNLRSLFTIIDMTGGEQSPDNQYLQALARAFVAGLAGFFASGTFVSVLYYAHYWYITAFIVAAEEIVFSRLADPEIRLSSLPVLEE